jgi:HEAT repeat protein
MSPPESIVDHYLRESGAGRCNDAFHGLIEADAAVISDLINAYEDTSDLDTKTFVIEVISEFRLESSLCFLRHALRSDDARIWKTALNGMAKAESPEALDAMDHVLSSIQDFGKRDWIKEAITNTNMAIMKKAEQAGSELPSRGNVST